MVGRFVLAALVSMSVAAVALSCGEDDGDSAASGPAGGDTTTCTNLEPGPLVDLVVVAESPPQATGGSVTDGTYLMTSVTKYTGPVVSTAPKQSHKGAFRVSGDKVELVDGDQVQILRAAGTFSSSGTTMTVSATCPFEYTKSGEYTATPTVIKTYSEVDGGTQILEYIKQ